MADYRTISSGFWNDPYIEELQPQEKLLYIYLFTCPHTNNAGILHISFRKMAFETGIDDVTPLIDKFSDDGKLFECEGYFWVVNFIKHQSSTSPKIIQSIGKALNSVPVPLADRVLTHYKELQIPYAYPIDTPSIPYAELERELEKEDELERECEEEISSKDPESPKCDDGSKVPRSFAESSYRDESYDFADRFKAIAPKSVKFDRHKWAMVWYHLRETDARADPQELWEAIQWARGHPFWSSNFHSPLKLRRRNNDGMMFIDVFIEQMRKQKTDGYATTDQGKTGNPHAIANAAALKAVQH